MSDPKKYGLIGAKLAHSFSQNYFTEKFDKQNINAIYLNYELNSVEAIKDLINQGDLIGVNVTIPYKEQILPLLDELDSLAAELGAVNTIKFIEGKTKGFNTDVFGFKQMIKPFFKSHHERAMILGTGGASKAVAYVLEELGSKLIFISRNPKGKDQFHYSEINEYMMKFNPLIVNTTPLGTFPGIDEMPDVPVEFITPEHLVIDLIYNPERSKLLQLAASKGATVLNGRTMLEQQAEKSWEIWNE